MAIIEKWTLKQTASWEEWVAKLPAVSRDLAERFPPNYLYRLKSTGQRVTIKAYSDKGTLSVAVSGDYNRVVFNHVLPCIAPLDLEECELPGLGEDVGATLTELQDIREYVAMFKQATRQ